LRGVQLSTQAPKIAEAQSYRAANKIGRETVLKRILNGASESADRQLMAEIGREEIVRRMREAAQKKAS
jgi:hypothetical protein